MDIPILLFAPINTNLVSPCLGLSLIKAGLTEQGLASRIVYLNFLFHEVFGGPLFKSLHHGSLYNLAFERLFAPFAHDGQGRTDLRGYNGEEAPPELEEYYRILGTLNRKLSAERLRELEARAEEFIDRTVAMLLPLRPGIVGFSNCFQQVNASIALARAIRKALPETLLVIGGSDCDGAMGEEIASSFPIFDYVFRGEAEIVFPQFCRAYLDDGARPDDRLVTCPPTRDLDSLPIPDHSDFFEQSKLAPRDIALAFEGSRGCWWGARKQCAFCGECAMESGYRQKSGARLADELCLLREQYPEVKDYYATDSVLPYSYVDDLAPRLKAQGFKAHTIGYEVRTTLGREQLGQLNEIGINRLVPGIESLSTRLLGLMGKGTTAVVNVRFLRNCRELGMTALWLLLVGIPGDQAADYEEQTRLIGLLQHFTPPHFSPVRIPRFSPYFNEPDRFGITDVRPIKPYGLAYPEGVQLARLAYFFEGRFPSEARERPEILIPLKQAIDRWHERWRQAEPPRLELRPGKDGAWQVEDTRDCAKAAVRTLSAEEYAILAQCRKGLPADRVQPVAVAERLKELGFLAAIDNSLLSLCTLAIDEG